MSLNKDLFRLVPHAKSGVTLQEKNVSASTEKEVVWRTVSHHANEADAEKAAAARKKK